LTPPKIYILDHDRGRLYIQMEDHRGRVFINPFHPPMHFRVPIPHSRRDMYELLAFWNRPYVDAVESGEGYQVWRLDGGAARRPTLLSRGILSLDDAVALAESHLDDDLDHGPVYCSLHHLLAGGKEWQRLEEWFDLDDDDRQILGIPDAALGDVSQAG
jgi:hypothetical protein